MYIYYSYCCVLMIEEEKVRESQLVLVWCGLNDFYDSLSKLKPGDYVDYNAHFGSSVDL